MIKSESILMLWPEGEPVSTESLPPEIDKALLSKAVDNAFAEPDPKKVRNTRAVVVVYQGRIAAERYTPGFSKDTPLIGWSMTKSIARGCEGQNVIVILSRQLVLVHLCACVFSSGPGAWEPEEFISDVLKAIKKQP